MAASRNIVALLFLCLPLAACDLAYGLTMGAASYSPITKMKYNSALKRAEKGDAKAQAQVAGMVHYACYRPADALSWTPPCDEDTCAKWNTLAAESGDARSQFRLGEGYLIGKCGVKRDPANTAKWLGKAAEQGDINAANKLADAYAVGDYIDRDDALAAKWYRVAADKGSDYAQMSLAHIYMSGIGVEQDAKQAIEWGLKVARGGSAYNQRQLAKLYLETGDYAEAYYWSSYAWARRTSDIASDDIVFTDLDKHLTPDQIASIDARVKADVAKQGGE